MDIQVLDKVFVVNYYDIDKLIKEHFNPDYDIVADNYFNNDMEKLYKNIGQEKEYNFQKNDYIELINSYTNGTIKYDEYMNLGSYLDLLAYKGLIEPGHYIIKISW